MTASQTLALFVGALSSSIMIGRGEYALAIAAAAVASIAMIALAFVESRRAS